MDARDQVLALAHRLEHRELEPSASRRRRRRQRRVGGRLHRERLRLARRAPQADARRPLLLEVGFVVAAEGRRVGEHARVRVGERVVLGNGAVPELHAARAILPGAVAAVPSRAMRCVVVRAGERRGFERSGRCSHLRTQALHGRHGHPARLQFCVSLQLARTSQGREVASLTLLRSWQAAGEAMCCGSPRRSSRPSSATRSTAARRSPSGSRRFTQNAGRNSGGAQRRQSAVSNQRLQNCGAHAEGAEVALGARAADGRRPPPPLAPRSAARRAAGAQMPYGMRSGIPGGAPMDDVGARRRRLADDGVVGLARRFSAKSLADAGGDGVRTRHESADRRRHRGTASSRRRTRARRRKPPRRRPSPRRRRPRRRPRGGGPRRAAARLAAAGGGAGGKPSPVVQGGGSRRRRSLGGGRQGRSGEGGGGGERRKMGRCRSTTPEAPACARRPT